MRVLSAEEALLHVFEHKFVLGHFQLFPLALKLIREEIEEEEEEEEEFIELKRLEHEAMQKNTSQ